MSFSEKIDLNLAKVYQKGEEKLSAVFLVLKRKRRREKIIRVFRCLIILFAAFLLLNIAWLLVNLSDLNFILNNSLAGKSSLEKAIWLAREESFGEAVAAAAAAEKSFNLSRNRLNSLKGEVLSIFTPLVSFQLKHVDYLLVTAEVLARAVGEGTEFAGDLKSLLEGNKKLDFSGFTREEKGKILKRIHESGPELNGMKANLELALLNLNKVSYWGALWPLKEKVEELKEKIAVGQEILAKSIPLSQLLPALAGYPEKTHFLILLENSDELRPTGGFIGTYGLVEMDYGDIARFETYDVYHLDMPVKDKIKIEPPAPLKKYLGVDRWYLRDANWSPDWPTTARKVLWFYSQEAKALPDSSPLKKDKDLDFTGVIGLTPGLISRLLSVTGPLTVDGEVYNEKNFTDLLQYKVEKGYVQLGVSSWQRKEVIGDIAKELKAKLFNLPSSRWRELLNVFNEEAAKNNLLVFMRDEGLESIIREQGMSGEVKETAADYFFVVDANLAAFKTDAVMNKAISYSLEEKDGGLFAKLRLSYSHHGGFDWKTTRYRTYTRVYVPLGSELINVEGMSEGQAETGEEFGRTVFGAFISVEPGAIGSLYLEYKLPDELYKKIQTQGYRLYAQKQPGRETEELNVSLSFAKSIKSYYPSDFYTEKKGNKISWKSAFNSDQEFGAGVEK